MGEYSYKWDYDWTYLLSALDNIEGADQGVGNTAGEDTSYHAFLVVS